MNRLDRLTGRHSRAMMLPDGSPMFAKTCLIVLGTLGSVALIMAAACSTPTAPHTEFHVGVILAETGPADFIGQPERAVLDALLASYREHDHTDPHISLSFQDSMGKVDSALIAFDNLSSDPSIIAIIGPSTSGESIALAEKAEVSGIPLLSLAASRQIVTDRDGHTREWVFKFAQNDDLAAARLSSAMATRKTTSVAMLYSNDGFGKSGADVFRRAVDSTGGLKLILDSAFDANLTAPEPVVASIPPEADAVLIWGTAPGPSLLVKALRHSGSQVQVYLSHGNASEEFLSSTGSAAEGAIVVGSRVLLEDSRLDPAVPTDAPIIKFRTFWVDKLQGPPSHFAGHARDALDVLATVAQSGTAPTRKGVRDAIEGLHNYHGVTGTFTFGKDDHAGLGSDAFETYQVVNGHFVQFP